MTEALRFHSRFSLSPLCARTHVDFFCQSAENQATVCNFEAAFQSSFSLSRYACSGESNNFTTHFLVSLSLAKITVKIYMHGAKSKELNLCVREAIFSKQF